MNKLFRSKYSDSSLCQNLSQSGTSENQTLRNSVFSDTLISEFSDKKWQLGASYLTLVLVVAMILTLVVFSIQLIVYLQVKKSTQSQHTKSSYYSAEGALLETIQHFRNDPDWPPSDQNPYQDTYQINQARIDRSLTNQNGIYEIEINSSQKNAKRRLTSTYQNPSNSTTTSIPIDIVLVLDTSWSSKHSQVNLTETTTTDTINVILDAAYSFVDHLVDEQFPAHLGLVSYDDSSRIDLDLTFDLEQSLQKLDKNSAQKIVATDGRTNIQSGIQQAHQLLNFSGQPNAHQIIVIMSDGAATYSHYCETLGNTYMFEPNHWQCWDGPQNSGCYPNSWQESYFSPNGYGSCCSHDAIETSNQNKSLYPQRQIYSVFFDNNLNDSCTGQYSQATTRKDFARATLLMISSEPEDTPLPEQLYQNQLEYYFETNSPIDLIDIYTQIATHIVETTELFEYTELPPLPDPSP